MNTIPGRKKPKSKCDHQSGIDEMLELGFLLPLKFAQTGLDLLTESLQKFKRPSFDFSNDCDWCNSDCWEESICSCCYTSDPATDLSVEGRLGERRVRRFIIENNLSTASTPEITVTALIDSCGNKLDPKGIISFKPEKATIAANSCLEVIVLLNLVPLLEAGNTYFAEIQVKGSCRTEAITLSICMEPEGLIDHLVLCDDCRPQQGRFVEFESCGCSTKNCGCSKTRRYYLCPCPEPQRDETPGNTPRDDVYQPDTIKGT